MKNRLQPRSPNNVVISKAPPAVVENLLTLDQALAALNTTRTTFYRWMRGGQIKGMKIGRQWRFLAEDVERLAKGQQPRVEVGGEVGPLIELLESRLRELGATDLAASEEDATARAVRLMILLAPAMHASDIHLDPRQDGVQLRYRVDGVLHLVSRLDAKLLPAIAERWKSLAGMDVREKVLPQDGRIVMSVGERNIDLRVCCMPAYLGESIVARVLSPEGVQLDLDRLEYSAGDRRRIDRWLKAPWGLVVVTGPTGCGKTTTLYSCLTRIADERTKVLSIEDPVEYVLPGLTQIGVNLKAGLTFERAFRSTLRSDPDVIMMGEVRNAESMGLCFQAAMTGHLVWTTLHVDEAASALRRMVDLGCEPFMVADSVKLIVAQRLVRKLCPDCSQEAEPAGELLSRAERLARMGGIGWDTLPRAFRKAVGCAKCGQLGYKHRTLIAETLEVTPEIAAALRRKATTEELRTLAVGQGMTTMAADGIRRAAEGTLSLAEVLSAVASVSY